MRTILLRLEASEEKDTHPTPPEGCGRERFEYHLEILADAGYIEVGNLVAVAELTNHATATGAKTSVSSLGPCSSGQVGFGNPG